MSGDVALKKLKQMPQTPRELQMFCREIQLLVQARHPNIVATYGLCMTEGYEYRLTQVPKSLALVMELMPHKSLFDTLHPTLFEKSRKSPGQARQLYYPPGVLL